MAKASSKASQPTSSKRYTQFDKVKTDDIILLRYYVKVVSKDTKKGEEKLLVSDLDRDLKMYANGLPIIESSFSADQFESEKQETQTQIAERLTHAKHIPFTVCFEKLDGSERVLRGRLLAPEPLMGRSQVHDLDIDSGNPMRLIDHRTIKWMIIENVKYIVKGK